MNSFDSVYYPQDTMRKSLTKSFGWMAIGLLLTAITSYLMYSTGAFLYILYKAPMLVYVLLIAQLGIVIGFSAVMSKASPTVLKVLFLAYAITLGISLTSLFFAYSLGTLGLAFGVSALYFASLAFIGITTKKDLSGIGTLCMVALFALIISQLLMMLFHVSMSARVYSFIGLLIFTGLTAWDVQRMRATLTMSNGDMVTHEKMAIYFALQLYLDFINIFLYILRLLGNSDN